MSASLALLLCGSLLSLVFALTLIGLSLEVIAARISDLPSLRTISDGLEFRFPFINERQLIGVTYAF